MQSADLYLIDGSYYLYRAYHALPPLTSPDGHPTGAIYGVVNMIKSLIREYSPSHLGVVFDPRGGSFRQQLYAEYKANRTAMPEDLVCQIEPIHQLIKALGIPLIVVNDYEADDVLATFATQAAKEQRTVLISSGDKDLMQLVDPYITLIDTMKHKTYDRAGVIKKFNLPPERIIDYLTLVGDSSDNVPGVPLIGPKTAVRLLTKYGTLDNILNHRDDITGKIGSNLRGATEQITLSKRLVTLCCKVPLTRTWENLALQTPDKEALHLAYQAYGFRTWLNELGHQPASTISESQNISLPTYHTIDDVTQLEQLLKRLWEAPLISVDLETTSLDVMSADIVGIAVAIRDHEGYYIPLRHQNSPKGKQQLSPTMVLERLKPLLEAEKPLKVGHNIKYDLNVFFRAGIALRGIAHDTMLQSYVLDSSKNRHSLDELAKRYFSLQTLSYTEVAGKGAKQIPFSAVDIPTATRYAAEDADVTLQLHQWQWPKLSRDTNLQRVYDEIEMPLLPIIAKMERTGVCVDVAMLHEQSARCASTMASIQQQAHTEAGELFNLSSPKQIQKILYGKMNLPITEKTPTGKPATSENVLTELAEEHLLPRLILEYRTLEKLKSTYTDALPARVNANTGRVHTSYRQAVASTGRLSSSDPNLQNIPIRTAEGRLVRQAFVAQDDSVLLAADYSQIELRIMAHLSQDTGLQHAFQHNQDVHRHTAAELFGIDSNAVQDEQRRIAKTINFGLIYGMSAYGLARQLHISVSLAKRYIDNYFSRYPGVLAYMEQARQKAREQGYAETIFKRRLYLPDILSRNARLRGYAERVAINAPMQGSAADIIKRAMIEIDRLIEQQRPPASLIMQVHDELVFEVKREAITTITKMVVDTMTAAAELSVPLQVTVGHGKNWDEAH